MSVMDALVTAWQANPEATESMIDDIVLDLLADEALDNADVLNKSAAAYVAQRTAIAKRALLRQYASEVSQGRYPDDEVHKAAQWLAGIEAFTVASVMPREVSKAAKWDEDKHPRGRGGRFTRGVRQGEGVSPLRHGDIARVHPAIRQRVARAGMRDLGGADPQRAEIAQAQYEQANEIMREFAAPFSASERKNIDIFVQARVGNEIKNFSSSLTDAADGAPDELFGEGGISEKDDILSIEIAPKGTANDELAAKVARFNTMGAMGGQQMAALASMNQEQRGKLTQALMPRRPEQGRLKRLFGQFNAGADVLERQGQDKLAGMARFMGEWGPEAEKVMDPRVRQAAYRYRGTEKEPDIMLMRQMNSPDMNLVEAAASEGGHGHVSDQIKAGTNRVGVTSPIAGSTRYNLEQADRSEEPLTEDQLNMRVRSDLAAMHLMQTIPTDRKVAELSQRAGNILPSQGVLIDADGDVVSQAVGFGDDTYLPFDYNNMKRSMRGGQYVRTRVQGGLTGEDIAAAVGNGARMATVVSSSGVHSIEFDPNLRGARANSDKARSMYRRYLQILDAVENSGMYEQDISGPEKSKIKARAAEIAGTRTGPTYDKVEAQLLEEARAEASQLTEEEMNSLMEQAKKTVISQGGGGSPQRTQQQINDVYSELEEQASAQKASKLRLNAEGYRVALETLQQQFPYFIRNVSFEPLSGSGGEPGFLDSRGQKPAAGTIRQRLRATDQGYMRPGGTRAASVREGFYRTDAARPGLKPDMGNVDRPREKSPEGPQAPGTPGAPGAPGAPSPGGLAGPTGGPEGGLTAKLAGLAGQAENDRKKALSTLSNISVSLQRFQPTQLGPAQKWETAKDLDNEGIVTYWLSQPDLTKALQDPEQGPRIAQALSDRPSVVNGFKNAVTQTASGDLFGTPESPTGNKFVDPVTGTVATTPDQAAELVADLAMRVVDTGLVTQPFVNPRGGDEGDPYHAGASPQNLKIGGIAANDITSSTQLKEVLASNPDAAALAQKIGMDPGGDNFLSSAAVASQMKKRISVLKDLQASMDSAAADEGRARGLPSNIGTHLKTSMDHSEYLNVLSDIVGQKITSTDDLVKLKAAHYNPDAEARKHQQAWALIGAGRGVNMAEGGGVFQGPKDLWEVQKAWDGSTRRARPVLERVSKDASPLAREISRRRLAGLPFVPAR